MGVGTPSDILGAVKRGIDMFDCVLPSRSGRTGLAFTWNGRVQIRNSENKYDNTPLDKNVSKFDLNNLKEIKAKFLSGGQKKKLVIALSLLGFNKAFL